MAFFIFILILFGMLGIDRLLAWRHEHHHETGHRPGT